MIECLNDVQEKSEITMTSSILKQDPNTSEVKREGNLTIQNICEFLGKPLFEATKQQLNGEK